MKRIQVCSALVILHAITYVIWMTGFESFVLIANAVGSLKSVYTYEPFFFFAAYEINSGLTLCVQYIDLKDLLCYEIGPSGFVTFFMAQHIVRTEL